MPIFAHQTGISHFDLRLTCKRLCHNYTNLHHHNSRGTSGHHKARECLPLLVVLRNSIKHALNSRETKAILMQRLMRVNGKKSSLWRRLANSSDSHMKSRAISPSIASQTEEAQYKLGKVSAVGTGKGSIPSCVTHDEIRCLGPVIRANDVVKIDMATGKILNSIKFDVGIVATVPGGHNIGRVRVVTQRERHDGGFNIVHVKGALRNVFAIGEANVFAISKERPWASLPKGKDLSIAEERDRHRVYTLAEH
ncbi:hypothetical protein K469DRAFT_726434 [Zopfia rhizophila CBS 207.26]|uniref:Small ribosomal subunit protein eS4 central region domain-containing protein n=1 Tax=Zopfia rhizophila CBS 207.26 TaxID=1314779 RepID=A0A6A6E2H9_9PEZI|nr:hypothetical protein K469DRAFT_726434 [Zopfia rhizophila CBS 207.26]